MRKKTPKNKPKSADTLLKTSKKAQVELTEQQLGKVSGGLGKLQSAATQRLVAVVDFCQPWVMCWEYGRWATDYPVGLNQRQNIIKLCAAQQIRARMVRLGS